MTAEKPSRSLPETARDARQRFADVEIAEAESCALCGAFVDPDATVLHRRFHDGLLPVRRIAETP